jgi:hypothetical protein
MKEDNYKEELKAMTDLFVKELALMGCRGFLQEGDKLSFTYNHKKGFVYPYTETFVYNSIRGAGLGELKEMISLVKPKQRFTNKDLPINHTNKIKTQGVKKCPNMDQYEALLNELGIYYDKLPMELIIMFEGYPVKIFPKKHWFTGRKVRDGRGIDNLRKQLTRFKL